MTGEGISIDKKRRNCLMNLFAANFSGKRVGLTRLAFLIRIDL
jgi:hypothetical protein